MRGRRSRGRKSGPSAVTIPVQATSVGAVSANQFTGWTHGAGTVFTRNAWGANTKYFETTASTLIQTVGVSRDHEVTFWCSIGYVYLRVADDGKALRFSTNVEVGGNWGVDYVSVGSTSDTPIENVGSGTVSGFNYSTAATDEWVFGVGGFDVYVKWNGVEQWRGKQIFHNKPGKVGIRGIGETGVYGFSSVSVDFKTSVPLYSTPEFKTIDVRDFGVFPYATTGSMTAGSATLTVASNPGFAIGDPIIVEIGGESGAGARGTRGVGGQWPTLVYADTTARDADTSQPNAKYAGVLSDGNVYTWSTTSSTWSQYTDAHYNKICPRALVTTITNISGTTFTLADAATVSTTNANVYMNVAEKYAEILGATYFGTWSYIKDFSIYWPDGNYAWGYTTSDPKGFGNNRINWQVYGQSQSGTVIFSPDGTVPLRVQMVSWTGGSIHNMKFVSNCTTDKGYLAYFNSALDYPEDAGYNIRFATCNQTEAYNITATEHQGGAIALSYCANMSVHDCTVSHTTGHRQYYGWAFVFGNSTDCTAENITLDFDRLTAGFEQFQCDGCTFDDFTARNSWCSVNSSSSWTWSNISITIEEDCAAESIYDWMLTGSPIVNLNSNINNQQGSGGYNFPGLFENFTIIQEGKQQVSGTGTFPWGNGIIALSGYNKDITLRGDFPAKPTTNGYIEVPAGYPRVIIVDSEPFDGQTGKMGTIAEGIRVKGGNASPSVIFSNATSSVTNCVLDDYTAAGTDTGNITNAAYDAL